MKLDGTKIILSVATAAMISFGGLLSYIGNMIITIQEDNADELILLTAKFEAFKNDMDLDTFLDFLADKDSVTTKDYEMVEIMLTRGQE